MSNKRAIGLLLRFNAEANPQNALKVSQDVIKEKGVADPLMQKYSLSDIVASFGAEIRGIILDGQGYTFATPVDTSGTGAEIEEGLRTGIEAAYAAHSDYLVQNGSSSLLYEGGLSIFCDETTLEISQARSHVVLASITHAAGAPIAFVPSAELW